MFYEEGEGAGHVIVMGEQGQMPLNDGIRGQRGLFIEDGDDMAGSLGCFQEERVAGPVGTGRGCAPRTL